MARQFVTLDGTYISDTTTTEYVGLDGTQINGQGRTLILSDYVLDNGLGALDTADKLYICSDIPTTYAEATSTYALGNKNFGAGNVFGALGVAASPVGRQITSAAVTGGSITASGTATRWAVVDSANSRLLANGIIDADEAVTSGGTFTLDAITIALEGGQAAVAPAWTPASLGSLVAWYDASIGVYLDAGTTLATTGENVAQWNDQSGHGYHLRQATVANRPIYQAAGLNGRPTISLIDLLAHYMATTSNAVALRSGTVSAFVVGQFHTASRQSGRWIGFATNGSTNDWNSVNSFSMNRNTTANNFRAEANSVTYGLNSTVLPNINYRFGMIFDAAQDVTTYLNNVAGTTVATTTAWDFGGPSAGNGTLAIGTYIGGIGSNEFHNAYISEIVVFSSELTSGERTSLDDYFKAKWGL